MSLSTNDVHADVDNTTVIQESAAVSALTRTNTRENKKAEWDVFEAAKEGDVKRMMSVLEDNESVNVDAYRDFYGKTALIVACAEGKTECVKLLLESKANVEAEDENGAKSLHFASGYADTRVYMYADVCWRVYCLRVCLCTEHVWISTPTGCDKARVYGCW